MRSNQPPAAVVANAHASLRWLSAAPPNLEKAREAVERIVRDGKDVGEVVQRIRSLFSGAVTDKGPLDLNELILEVVSLLFIRSGLHQSTSILIEVKDNVVGLDNPERVFEAFYTTKKAGMGMGLPISRTIIESDHGRLWADRRDNVGATFCFTVPVEGRDD
jgi:nitrogen-specific signal transduction histidine kinase